MARSLKTYQTSLGFFDLAVASPSMKAALDAWGADSNLFHQGAAQQSEDPGVISATMAKPGQVLKRPVGSNGPFTKDAELPTDLAGDGKSTRSARASRRSRNRRSHAPVLATRPKKEGKGKRSASAGSEPLTGRKRLWIRPGASMRRGPRPSRPKSRLSKRNHNPKTPAGTRREAVCRPRYGAHGVRISGMDGSQIRIW